MKNKLFWIVFVIVAFFAINIFTNNETTDLNPQEKVSVIHTISEFFSHEKPDSDQHTSSTHTANSTEFSVWTLFFLFPLGMYIGGFVFLFILPTLPGAIARLANKPNRYRPSEEEIARDYPDRASKEALTKDYPVSEFGFFTQLAPGQVKIIQMGERFVRCIMKFNDHTFYGFILENDDILNNELDISHGKYWEVVKTDGKYPDAHPIPRPLYTRTDLGAPNKWILRIGYLPVRIPWWLWKRWVYDLTGYVFTGVYPYRSVRTYPIERNKRNRNNQGREVHVPKEDYSDHFRVADFQFPLIIPEADTSDKIPVRMFIDIIFRVYNPYEAAYGTDNWASRLESAIADTVNIHTRALPLEKVLSAAGEEAARTLSHKIKEIGTLPVTDEQNPSGTSRKDGERITEVTSFGLIISQVLITDISPIEPSSDAQRKLGSLAYARIESDAMAARAVGQAAELREINKAVKKAGATGLAVLEARTRVNTAEAAGDRAIIILGGNNNTVDPVQVAALRELEALNKNKSTSKKRS